MGQCVITKKQYNVLQQDYNTLLIEKSNIIDSLLNDNKDKKESIYLLEEELISLNHTVDSLFNIKIEIQQSKSNFTISSNISDSSELLRRNLNEKTINYNF